MLLVTKLTTILGGFLIVGSSFSAVIFHQSDTNTTPAFTNYFQAIIDTTTGRFIAPNDESFSSVSTKNIVFKETNSIFSKKLSPVEGGGMIVNMNMNSFSQMRVVKDSQGLIHTQCSSY